MADLVTIRRAAAKAAGRYTQFTADSAGGTNTTIPSVALRSLSAVTELYNDYWIYLPAASAADKIRLVSSYAPTTSTTVGTLTTDGRVYSAASVPNSKVVELHGLFPPISDDLTVYSWTDAINDALKRLWTTSEFTITPTANATRHTLASQTWILSESQIRQVGYLVTGEARAEVDPYRNRPVYGSVEQDGATLYLHHPDRTFASNETIYVRAAKRVYDHCRASGGAYGDQSGLSAESNEAPVPVDTVMWGAMIAASENLRNELSDAAVDHLLRRQDTWRRKWTTARATYNNRLPAVTFRPRRYFFVDRRM